MYTRFSSFPGSFCINLEVLHALWEGGSQQIPHLSARTVWWMFPILVESLSLTAWFIFPKFRIKIEKVADNVLSAPINRDCVVFGTFYNAPLAPTHRNAKTPVLVFLLLRFRLASNLPSNLFVIMLYWIPQFFHTMCFDASQILISDPGGTRIGTEQESFRQTKLSIANGVWKKWSWSRWSWTTTRSRWWGIQFDLQPTVPKWRNRDRISRFGFERDKWSLQIWLCRTPPLSRLYP